MANNQSDKAKRLGRDAVVAASTCFVTTGINWLLHHFGLFG